jgi:two-component system OmpR family response regulator
MAIRCAGSRRRGEKTVTADYGKDDNDDVVVWRPIARAMASHRRVLVVDDYREAADALQLLLNADGFECRALEDPLAVCELAVEWQPFAVVLDIKMPGLDGFELARRLRADPTTAQRSPQRMTGRLRDPWVSMRIAQSL